MAERVGRLVRDKDPEIASRGGTIITTTKIEDEVMKYSIVDEMAALVAALRQDLNRPGDMGLPERRVRVMVAGGEILELFMRLGALHRGLTLADMMTYANHERKYFGGYNENLVETGRDHNG